MLQTAESIETLADLLKRLGDIAPERIRFRPPPGTASEKDVLDVRAREDRLCELVDGVLVEKGMGFRESFLGSVLLTILWGFVKLRNLGLVTGADGMMRLVPGLVRIPDVLRRNRIRPYLSRIKQGPTVDGLRVSRPIRSGHDRAKRSHSMRSMVVTLSG